MDNIYVSKKVYTKLNTMKELMSSQQIKNLIYLFEEFSKDEYSEMNIENYINYLKK